jgi:two-component system CheB/CheR fusion protein
VRDLCVFARQNLTVDPPFSRVDLLTCRNVLIYMSPALQQRLFPVFHFALNPGGFLVLGAAETVGSFSDHFELISRAHKIYKKTDTASRVPLTFLTDRWLAGVAPRPSAAPNRTALDVQREADRLTLDRYGPPGVLLNRAFGVVQFRGRTGPFLEVPVGQPTTDVLRMAKEGLFTELRSALAEAVATRGPVAREHLRMMEGESEFTMHILPVGPVSDEDGFLLVLFESADARVRAVVERPGAEAGASERDVVWLRQELASSRQYLQSVVDQQDATVQDVHAAHEELLSSNEELQSTNEEL